jgi:hypothetical protein
MQMAISMPEVEIFAKKIESRHALFIFDSCFSGTIFTQGRDSLPPAILGKFREHVRQFITAGDENESVPDVSIFKDRFIAAMKGGGDIMGDGYITGTELGLFLSNEVANYSRGAQHPQYGKLRDPAFDKGEFIFEVIEQNTRATEPPPPPPPPPEFGWLSIESSFETDVYVDGQLNAQNVKSKGLKLMQGRHLIILKSRQGYLHKEYVNVEAGKTYKMIPPRKL